MADRSLRYETFEGQSLKILNVDTSSSAGSILLAHNETILGEINVNSAQTHSARLLTGIDYLLKATALDLADLDAFAAICGPGSFTGIRIGLATIKGLADTTGKPTIPITAFEAWVEKFPARQGVIVPMIDARRGEIYAAVFERIGEELKQLSAGMVDKPAPVLARMPHTEILFIGDGSHKYQDLISNSGRAHWTVAACDPFLGRSMAPVAERRARQGQFTPAQDLQAYYIRKSDAELFWKEK